MAQSEERAIVIWLRELDSNQRNPVKETGYEPGEKPLLDPAIKVYKENTRHTAKVYKGENIPSALLIYGKRKLVIKKQYAKAVQLYNNMQKTRNNNSLLRPKQSAKVLCFGRTNFAKSSDL
tara:strand:- start:352 stop:714 length:363 start_codon:yes stop_codon:yes gene_type:complete